MDTNKNSLEILVPSQYSLQVVHKCMYWFTGKYDIQIAEDVNGICVRISPLNEFFTEEEINEIRIKVNKDLIDYYLREQILAETKTIRELILAKAFSHFDDEMIPESPVSDPVGFDPQIGVSEIQK